MVGRLIAAAVPEDSFALLTARGPKVQLPLGSSRDAILSAAQRMEGPVTAGPRGPAVIDAIAQAAAWRAASITSRRDFCRGCKRGRQAPHQRLKIA